VSGTGKRFFRAAPSAVSINQKDANSSSAWPVANQAGQKASQGGVSASKKALVFCKVGDPYKWQFYGEINPCSPTRCEARSNIITCARRRLFNLLATRDPKQQLKRLAALLVNYLFVHFRRRLFV